MTKINIESNLGAVRERIERACRRAGRSTDEITLIAVTKTVEASQIEAAFKTGIRNFGENRVQEAGEKIKDLIHLQPRPSWHMIGHLQSNKVKPALELFDIIQSVDTIRLAQTINQRTCKKVPIFLQVNVAEEKTKTGFALNSVISAFDAISQLPFIDIKGLMTVAPLVDRPEDVRPVFRKLKMLADAFHLEHVSMGMTDDFEVAIEEGATIVRIGRAIFGERRA